VKDLLPTMPTTNPTPNPTPNPTLNPTPNPTPNPAPNFDKLAKPYRWLEYLTFGPILQRTRTHFLTQLPELAQRRPAPRHALVLGDGDGRFTAALLRTHPEIQVHAVDLSPAMLQSLRKASRPHTNRLTVEAADLRHWLPASKTQYDLIATHFFLDCLTTEEIASLASRITPNTTPNAQWLVSDFAVPPTHFGHLLARPLVAFLYHAFRLLTGLNRGQANTQLPNHQSALEQAGWSLQSHHARLRGLLISQLGSRPR
jgi:SAM-dependent methyltransferase